MNKDQILGSAKQKAGAIKAKTGEVLHLKELKDKGKIGEIEGAVQKKIGDIRNVIDD